MFGFSTGKAAYPPIYQVKKKDVSLASPSIEAYSSEESLEPAIDGPPSPERIRAYTEQVKRSSIFGNHSRANTLSSSSASSSFRSHDSTHTSTDGLSLSRKSSTCSTGTKMPSSRSDRPESSQIFGSIFSRGGRKAKKESSLASTSIVEEGSAREQYYGKAVGSRRGVHSSGHRSKGPQSISEPYNFQHVTHAQRENMSTLPTSPKELTSSFTTFRPSQIPTHNELKGITAQDLLHFENFSSEALNMLTEEEEHAQPSQLKIPPRKASRRPHLLRPMSHAKSYDNLRVIAPPRPPRSPLSPTCPIQLTPRTSSRTASILFDTFDPLDQTAVDRTLNHGAFGRPAHFSLPTPPEVSTSLAPSMEEFLVPVVESDDFISHAITTPGDEAWPLTASLTGSFGCELPDVQEEEEVGSRKSKTSSELRASQSSPALRIRTLEEAHDPLPALPAKLSADRPLSSGFRSNDDSWEQDIDYCYEHEIEADCDYQWDTCSMDESTVVGGPALELHLEDNDRSYGGRFRPSLLIPSAFDIPELSPLSNASAMSSNPRTPQNFNRLRPSSQASSFKESHGFHLSPSLLIPTDFKTQMDSEAYPTYDEFSSPEVFTVPISPIDETSSSVVSYRSSNFSRGSARSSSNNRLSSATSRFSGDAYRSVGSSSSLPDLIPSSSRNHDNVQGNNAHSETTTEAQASTDEMVKAEQQVGTTNPVATVFENFGPTTLPGLASPLSPVAEVQTDVQATRGQLRGRKSSAPVVSQTMKDFKSRPRAGTYNAKTFGGKKRGSYLLFPQT